MGNLKNVLVILISFPLLNSQYMVKANSPQSPTINKCSKLNSDFEFTSPDFNGRDIRMPLHLTIKGHSPIFRLTDNEVKCTGKYLTLSWENNVSEHNRGENSGLNIGDAFYSDGRLRHQMQYYLPEEYCISKITADSIIVKVCPSDCEDKAIPCIKKCCDVHQVLNYQHTLSSKHNYTPQCQDSGDKEWRPVFYRSILEKARIDNDPTLSQTSQNSFRLTKVVLPCETPTKIPMRDFSRQFDSRRDHYRLKMLQNGKVYLYKPEEETWQKLSSMGYYCIDGVGSIGSGRTYTGDESDQMALVCIAHPDFESRKRYATMSDVYFGVYFFSSVFLFLMMVIYFLLLNKHNLHGQIVFSYAVTMFLQYIFFGVVHYLNSTRMDEPDNKTNWDCFFLAITVHYLYLSSFCWLTTMNYDLFITFREVKIVTPSSVIHFYKRYCIFAWILPSVFILLSVIVDVSVTKSSDMTMLPSYGGDNCYMSRDSLGPFLFYELAVILVCNVVLIILTFWEFYQMKVFASDTNKAIEKYSLWKIFLRLFLVMFVAFIFEILVWINIGNEVKWYWAILDILIILQAVAIFIVYCCNERTYDELESKYPGATKLLKKLFCCRCSSTYDSATSPLFGNRRKKIGIPGYM